MKFWLLFAFVLLTSFIHANLEFEDNDIKISYFKSDSLSIRIVLLAKEDILIEEDIGCFRLDTNSNSLRFQNYLCGNYDVTGLVKKKFRLLKRGETFDLDYKYCDSDSIKNIFLEFIYIRKDSKEFEDSKKYIKSYSDKNGHRTFQIGSTHLTGLIQTIKLTFTF